MINLSGIVGEEITLNNIISEAQSGVKDAMITTFGGSLFEGKAIRDYLKTTNIIDSIGCVGIVASSGTIIIQGVKDKWATPGTKFMIHNPQGIAQGDAAAIRKTADELQVEENELINDYVAISGQSFEYIQALMREERLLTADEALSLNLINRIVTFENFMNKKEDQLNWLTTFANKLKDVLGAKNLVVQSTDGQELDFGSDVQTLEQVVEGVPCSVDGEFVLADGRTIKVEGGKVTSVTEPEEEPDPMIAELQAKVAELQNQLEISNKKVADFENKKKEFETLSKEFNEFKNQFSTHVPDTAATPPKKEEKVAFNFTKKQ